MSTRRTRRSTTSRSCWRRPEAARVRHHLAVHTLRFDPRSLFPSDRMLTSRERVVLASLRGPRAAEWAAARVAAKECVVRLWDPPPRPDSVEVDRDPSGVPWAVMGERRVPLSLSHARGWAAAASHARLRVGVDVEPLRPLPVRFSRYFLSLGESSRLDGWGDPTTAALAAWTVKEAVLKAIGCGLSIPPRAVRLRGMDTDGRVDVVTDETEVGAACWREEGAVVAVACAGARELPILKRSRDDL